MFGRGIRDARKNMVPVEECGWVHGWMGRWDVISLQSLKGFWIAELFRKLLVLPAGGGEAAISTVPGISENLGVEVPKIAWLRARSTAERTGQPRFSQLGITMIVA